MDGVECVKNIFQTESALPVIFGAMIISNPEYWSTMEIF